MERKRSFSIDWESIAFRNCFKYVGIERNTWFLYALWIELKTYFLLHALGIKVQNVIVVSVLQIIN